MCVAVALSVSARVVEHILYYSSTDQRGDTLTLSGKISVPEQPKGIILLPHYTISANDEVPSNTTSPEAKYLRDEYVLVMPDYIGYGITRERVHPYLRGDVTARNCVDMLFASWPVLDSLQVTLPKDSIYIVGFSQGGASALWTLKLIEEQYSDRICVKQCFAGSGPYDVAATYDVAVAQNMVWLPIVIPMLIMGTSEAYDLGLKREDFFTPELDKRYDDYVLSKERTITYTFFRMPSHKVDYWLTAYGADKRNPETRRMYEGLLQSSLVHYPLDTCAIGQEEICPEWRPKAPVYVFHSYDDRIVTFHCAEHLQRCWSDCNNVTFDFGHYGNHIRSLMTFYPRVKKQLKRLN